MGLETVEIVMDMEDYFHVSIPDATASNCITVADLQNVIVNLMADQGRQPGEELRREVWQGMMSVLANNQYPVERIGPQSKWVGDITNTDDEVDRLGQHHHDLPVGRAIHLHCDSYGLEAVMKRVGFWLRVCAAVIDCLVVLLIAVLLVLMWPSLSQRAINMFFYGAVLAYTTMEVFWAGTIGKLLLRVRIRNTDGTPADFWKLVLRWSSKQCPLIFHLVFVTTGLPLFYLLGGFSAFIVLVGCLFASNDDKRAWHDQWAKTAVYKWQRVAQPSIPMVMAGPTPDKSSADDSDLKA